VAYTIGVFTEGMHKHWMFRSEVVVASTFLLWFTAAAVYSLLVSR